MNNGKLQRVGRLFFIGNKKEKMILGLCLDIYNCGLQENEKIRDSLIREILTILKESTDDTD